MNFFTLFTAQKPAKLAIFTIFGILTCCSKKRKISKMRSGLVFCNLEKYLFANFQVKSSCNNGGVAFLRSFFFQILSQNTVLLSDFYVIFRSKIYLYIFFAYFFVHFWPFNGPVTAVKNMPLNDLFFSLESAVKYMLLTDLLNK